MKFKIEVDAISWEVNTYVNEANSEEEIQMDLMDGSCEGILELTETFSDSSVITNIRSVKPYTETP